MRHCIPNELFNRIPYPAGGTDLTGIDGICREMHYKLPNAEDVVVRREAWHALCDFCGRLGALLERKAAASGTVTVELSPVANAKCKFMYVVGAEADGKPTTDFAIAPGDGVLVATFAEGSENCAVVMAVRPAFDDMSDSAGLDWSPQVPRYVIDRYGECIAHGALARLYAMRGEGGLARLHATAYNNDLNRLAFGLVTSGMRKHLLIDIEDWLVNTNGNG